MILDYLLNIISMTNIIKDFHVDETTPKIKLLCTSFFNIWTVFFSPSRHHRSFMFLYYFTLFISTKFYGSAKFFFNWISMYYEKDTSLRVYLGMKRLIFYHNLFSYLSICVMISYLENVLCIELDISTEFDFELYIINYSKILGISKQTKKPTLFFKY